MRQDYSWITTTRVMLTSGTERVSKPEDRNLDFLKDVVRKLWKVMRKIGLAVQAAYPASTGSHPDFLEELANFHAGEILQMDPDLPPKQCETEFIKLTGVTAPANLDLLWQKLLGARFTPGRLDGISLPSNNGRYYLGQFLGVNGGAFLAQHG